MKITDSSPPSRSPITLRSETLFPDALQSATWVANKPGYTFEHFSKECRNMQDLMKSYDGWKDFKTLFRSRKKPFRRF
ncbi:hypothetical protein CS542_08250 [Pedobacter sp. IW39]|nr:hypothetical protein CS542_08250 [Pedobacter sp. IW39]